MRRERGVTLIEVLIVVAILSLISTGVTVAVVHLWEKARRDTAAQNAASIRNAAMIWRTVSGTDECPSFDQLVNGKVVDEGSSGKDPWGTSYQIRCSDSGIAVISFGKDRKEATEDDIVAPEKKKPAT